MSGSLNDSFESFNHAPIDNTHRFMDNHGEVVTKAAIIAGLIYGGLGGGLSGSGGSGGGGAAGGGSSGGMFSAYGPSAMQNLSKLGGNMGGMGQGGQDQQPKINPLLAMMMRNQPDQMQQYTPVPPGVLSQYMG